MKSHLLDIVIFTWLSVVLKEPFHITVIVVTNDVVVNMNRCDEYAFFCYFEVDARFCLTPF